MFDHKLSTECIYISKPWRGAFRSVVITKGRRKGMFRRTKPKAHRTSREAAAWQILNDTASMIRSKTLLSLPEFP
ncbi:MAG: hypothetical protein ABFS45_06270 [Pseudomonadota bacterium]